MSTAPEDAAPPRLDALPLFADPPSQPAAPVPPPPPPGWLLAHPTPPADPSASAPPAAPDPNAYAYSYPVPNDSPAAGPADVPGLTGDSATPRTEIDWGLVRAFRQNAATRLATLIAARPGIDDEIQRAEGLRIVDDLLDEQATRSVDRAAAVFTADERATLAKAVLDSLFHLGRLQPLVEVPTVENIEVIGHDNVVLEHAGGRLERVAPVADSDEELIDWISFIASRSQATERAFTTGEPTLHLRMDNGARLAAAAWITPRPVISIRMHRLKRDRLSDLAGRDMFSPLVSNFLSAAVRANRNIIVAGAQGSGKTTLVRALAGEIPPWERIGTIETEYELHLHEMPERHPRCIAFEARPGTGERRADGTRAGEYTVDAIIYDSFRFNLARQIVGEVRGREVLAMFKAMQSGTGSLSTVHATSARAAISRLAMLAMEAGAHITDHFAERMIAEHIDLIVFVRRVDLDLDGDQPRRARYVNEIIAIEPGESRGTIGVPAITTVFSPGRDGKAAPLVLNERCKELADYGFDVAAFEDHRGDL